MCGEGKSGDEANTLHALCSRLQHFSCGNDLLEVEIEAWKDYATCALSYHTPQVQGFIGNGM